MQNVQGEKEIILDTIERIEKDVKGIRAEYPSRESDEFDKGRKSMQEEILVYLSILIIRLK